MFKYKMSYTDLKKITIQLIFYKTRIFNIANICLFPISVLFLLLFLMVKKEFVIMFLICCIIQFLLLLMPITISLAIIKSNKETINAAKQNGLILADIYIENNNIIICNNTTGVKVCFDSNSILEIFHYKSFLIITYKDNFTKKSVIFRYSRELVTFLTNR